MELEEEKKRQKSNIVNCVYGSITNTPIDIGVAGLSSFSLSTCIYWNCVHFIVYMKYIVFFTQIHTLSTMIQLKNKKSVLN